MNFVGLNRPNMPVVAGTTRFNTQINQLELYDGQQWVIVSADEIKPVTLAGMVENAEDQIAVLIEEEYTDNATIQDAFKAWEEANERFRVVLAIAEKK